MRSLNNHKLQVRANVVNGVGYDLSELSYLVEEIVSLSLVAQVVSFMWCSREANGVAHHLARLVVSFGNFGFCFVNIASSFSKEVVTDSFELPVWFPLLFFRRQVYETRF